MPTKLVMFDVDGTLVDSQGDIIGAMDLAFEGAGLHPPAREAILNIVGLSLDVAMLRLAPEADASRRAQLVEGYKAAYMQLRAQIGVAQSSPLYPGARAMLETLHSRDDVVLGVATGKSRRGLDTLIDGHDLHAMFVTMQVSDNHPSKPNPSMLLRALAETGVAAQHAVMVGDTSFDMDMAAAAKIAGIGVSWGYHDTSALAGAETIIDQFSELPAVLETIWGCQT